MAYMGLASVVIAERKKERGMFVIGKDNQKSGEGAGVQEGKTNKYERMSSILLLKRINFHTSVRLLEDFDSDIFNFR